MKPETVSVTCYDSRFQNGYTCLYGNLASGYGKPEFTSTSKIVATPRCALVFYISWVLMVQLKIKSHSLYCIGVQKAIKEMYVFLSWMQMRVARERGRRQWSVDLREKNVCIQNIWENVRQYKTIRRLETGFIGCLVYARKYNASF